MRTETITVKTKARVLCSKRRPRVRFYDVIPANDDGHPVDLAVQRWLPHVAEHRSIVTLQDELLAALAPSGQRLFLELEELRNTLAAEREEAYFDAGVGHGIERERRRCFRRFGRSHEVVRALGDALSECLALSEESLAGGSKAR